MNNKHLTFEEWLKEYDCNDFSDYEQTLSMDTQYLHYVARFNKLNGIDEVLSDGMS